MPRRPLPESRFRWIKSSGRYIDSRNGRFVAKADIQRSVERALKNAGIRITRDTNAMRNGKFPLGAWETKMRENIKDIHLYSASVTRGGFGQLTSGDLRTISNQLTREYTYLNKFSRGLQSGAIPNDGRVLPRARLYTGAARRTAHLIERKAMRDADKAEERNIRHPGDSCSGCINESARGWVPLGSLVPVGLRTCRGNCNCGVEYR